MKLKRLVIQGFKSFKDRTTIHFDNGITGIVGPNGCGKSNIVDALFWVMGEQSAKHLRGNSMKDVIFAGSSKYNPGAWAEATLVLENNEGKHIHIGNKVSSPSEIQLTRKLYRNGETEYRINGAPARLKDIQEVFMDTGAGAKSYSIIAQGEINRLVQAKPVERRTMIEEVAGITKFKVRKRESLKKIEQTQSNLSRLNDLQMEIEKNLRSLQKQAEKAERARSLKDKIKRNEITVDAHKVFDHLKFYRDTKTLLNEKRLDIETWQTRKQTLEVSLQEERLKKDEMTKGIEALQKEFNEVSKELAAAEERLNHLCQNQTQKESLVETRENEIEELREELAGRSEKLEQLKAQQEELEAKRDEDHNFDELEERVEGLREEVELKQTAVNELKEELEAGRLELQELDQDIFRNTSKLEEYAAQLQDITQEIEALEKQYSGVSTQIADERDAVHAAEKLAGELEEKEKELRANIDEQAKIYREMEEDLKSKSKDMIQKESKLSSLIEIRASLEGVKEGAMEFLGTENSEGYGLLGDLLQCEEKYTRAVQNLLGQFMDTLVSSKDEANQFYGWCKDNTDKAVDFLMTSADASIGEETIERLKLVLGEELVSLNDVLTLPEEYQSKLAPFFAGYFLVPELSSEQFERLSTGSKFKAISSFDGSMIIRNFGEGKIFNLSGNKQGMGAVERNNQIVELEASLETLRSETTELEAQAEEKKVELETNRQNYDALRDQLSETKADHASKKSALESKLANMETGTARLEILQNRKSEISKSRLEMMETEEVLANKVDGLREKIETHEERYEEQVEELNLQKASLSEEKEDLLQKQVEAKSFHDRLESANSQVEDIRGQIERLEGKLTNNNDLVTQYKEEIEEIVRELSELETNNEKSASLLQEKELVLNEHKDQLGNLLREMQEREDEVKKLTSDINKTDKETSQLDIKVEQSRTEEEQLVRNIFEKYRVDLRLAIGQYLEYEESDFEELVDVHTMYFMETEEGTQEIQREPYEFNRRYGQDLKDCSHKLKNYKSEYNRLGEINWQAIEDYERQKMRHDFLKVQEGELKASLEDLEQAIEHIDQKSKERFKIAFDEVNMRFEKVFPIIFGGGNAMLKVTGNADDPDSGVDIIAQPPGKKMQNINLMSGGEKALTAVSLIFSIFLVKPSPFCLLDEVDAPLDDANVGRFNELLREMSNDSQFILITHNKKTMELNDTLYGVTMQEPGVSKAVSVQLH